MLICLQTYNHAPARSISRTQEIVVGGGTMGVAGTSCATPTFAGVLSILNDVRLLAGKPTLGFFNPLLYKLAAENAKVSRSPS